MLSLPHLPSPPYFFNKVPEVSVKAGGVTVGLGNYPAAAQHRCEAWVRPGELLQLKSALSAGHGCSRWGWWAPIRTYTPAG